MMDDPGVISLTRGLVRCDEVAWRRFHEQWFARLRTGAIRRGVRENDAEEVVQGVYLRVLRHARVFRTDRDFERWLHCLVRCEAVDLLRKARRRSWWGERFQQWQEIRRAGPPVEGDRDLLGEALHCLDGDDRLLVIHHYVEGWSQEELALQRGLSVKAVESKLARLRKRLRKNWENPEIC